MKKYEAVIALIATILTAGALAATFAAPEEARSEMPARAPAPEALPLPVKVIEVPSVTHAQLVWSYALEWCESRGNPEAVNPKDNDGTPSYYAFQFKPDTFALFAGLYGVTGAFEDYDAQRAVIEQMLLHYDQIDWPRQFPGCIRKIDMPPRS